MGKNEREGERCEILAGKILCYIIKSLVHTSPFRKFTSFLGGSTHFPKCMGYKPLFQIPHSFFPGWIPIWELKSLVACLTSEIFGLLAHVTQTLESDGRKKKLVWDRETNQYSGLLSWLLKGLEKLSLTTKLLSYQIGIHPGKMKEKGIWGRMVSSGGHRGWATQLGE